MNRSRPHPHVRPAPCTELSAGAVIVYRTAGQTEYLLLQYRHGRWDFPRGHLERGETEVQAARREVREEIGLPRVAFVPGFREVSSWSYRSRLTGKQQRKCVTHFLVAVGSRTVHLDFENLAYRWLPYRAALRLPMFPHVRRVLGAAHQFTSRRSRTL